MSTFTGCKAELLPLKRLYFWAKLSNLKAAAKFLPSARCQTISQGVQSQQQGHCQPKDETLRDPGYTPDQLAACSFYSDQRGSPQKQGGGGGGGWGCTTMNE